MSLLTRWLESLAESIEVNKSCLREVSPFSKCTKCIDECSEEAFSLKNGKIVFDEDKCNSCGRCMTVCPVHAIEGNVPKREVIGDTMIYQGGFAPTVTEWLYYYHKGVTKITETKQHLDDRWKQSLDDANHYLQTMQLEPFTITDTIPQKEQKELTRRELFSFLAQESKTVAMSSLTPAKWRFNHTAFSLNRAFPEWNFFSVEIDEAKCNLCEVCFKLCPAKVFALEGNTLKMDLSKCNGCSLCQDVCQEHALTVKEQVQSKQIEEHPLHELTCTSCHKPFLTWNEEQEKCYVCERTVKKIFI